MKQHDKISFVREYCLCRRIPYRIMRESLCIAGEYFCYSVYNLTYSELVQAIDKVCVYDETSTFFIARRH